MGWQFTWVSSHATDFNRDFHVSFTPDDVAIGRGIYNFREQGFPAEEAPGFSVFYKDDAGQVYHTYSTYARGGEPFIGVYTFLDMVPKGRDEDGLAFSMSWVRHHDRYDESYRVDPARQYAQPAAKADVLRSPHDVEPALESRRPRVAGLAPRCASRRQSRSRCYHCSPQRRTSAR